MAEGALAGNRWVYGLAYFGVTSVIILLQIMPVEIGPNGYPGPDLLLCVTFAWVLRRPQYVPTPLIALVFLVTDLLFLRPPGLWTALVVLGVEFLRAREATSRELPFLAEWVMVTAVMVAMTLANWLVLAVFMVAQAGFGLAVLQLAATILTYPLIVLLSVLVFGVNKMSPGETDATGRPR
jgi:rod shape-determining protein MreD